MSLSRSTEQLRDQLNQLESVTMRKATPHEDPELDERTLTTFFGSVLGGLAHVAKASTIRRVVRWWADNDQAWEDLEAVKNFCKPTPAEMAERQRR
jgi:hypothetical protein